MGFIFHRIKQPSPLSNYTVFSSSPPSMLLLFSHPVVSDSVTPWTAARQTSLSLTIYQSLSKFMIITSVMLSSRLILWCPLLLLPSIFPSIRDFSSESSVHIRWPKYWNFSFSISPSSEYSGLISLKIDWFDLLAVRGTFRSLLQHHSSKSSILWHSAFFTVQLSQSPSTPKTSFRIDWLNLLAVQGMLKSLLQHHRSKASILWCSSFLV